MYTIEGKIEIDMADFWAWVAANYAPCEDGETRYGVPMLTDEHTMSISFAASSDLAPEGWTPKPAAVTEWEEWRIMRQHEATQ